jgi:hypothetical protein
MPDLHGTPKAGGMGGDENSSFNFSPPAHGVMGCLPYGVNTAMFLRFGPMRYPGPHNLKTLNLNFNLAGFGVARKGIE